MSKLHELVLNVHLTDHPVKVRALTHTRTMIPNAFKPGDPSFVASFVSLYDAEPENAAYLGYQDLGEYRKFQMSFHVIEYFQVYTKHCSSTSARVALELIRDVPNIQSQLPQDLSEAVKAYTAPTTSTDVKVQKFEAVTNLSYLMATLLYRLAETIQSSPSSYTDAEVARRQEAAAEGFHQVTKAVLPTGFDVRSVIFPRLGPHTDMGEDVLEVYNRTYNLLRSISHSLQASIWNEKFAKASGDPFQSLNIHASSIPQWMVVSAKPISNFSNFANLMRTPPLPPKTITLLWERSRKTIHTEAMNAHIQGFIEFKELPLPETPQACVKDPRAFPFGEMWRDTVRRQLRLPELRLDIVTMRLTVSDGSEATEALVYGRGQPACWNDVQILLGQAAPTFSYTLRALSEDEDFEFEYQGPPFALYNDLCLGADSDEIRRQALLF